MGRSTFSEDDSISFGIRSSLLNNSMLLYEPRRPTPPEERNYFSLADDPLRTVLNGLQLDEYNLHAVEMGAFCVNCTERGPDNGL
jgi:hypothetical protein